MRIFLALIFLLLLLNPIGLAVNYFVATTGNDGNSGLDSTNAWLTLDNGDQNAIMAPGDTVFIYPGTYILSAELHTTIPGTAANPIVYTKLGSDNVILDGNDLGNIVLFIESNHTFVKDLNIINVGDNHGIHLKADSCQIINCAVNDAGKYGIRVEGSYNLLQKNIVYKTVDDAIRNESGADNNIYYGNTVSNSAKTGFELNTATSRLFNNIVINNGTRGINGNSANICAYNDVWNNATGNYNGGVYDSTGGFEVDPLIFGADEDEFWLESCSPCIDAGLNIGYSYTGIAPDMGALEFASDTLDGHLIWRTGTSTIPQERKFNETVFGSERDVIDIASYRIMAGSEAPKRDEMIIVGVDNSNNISGMMRDSCSWTALPMNNLSTVTESFWWGFDVAYESQCGNAMLVFNNGNTSTKGISFYTWDGISWSIVDTATVSSPGEPKHMVLASNPTRDEMVLAVSNSDSKDYALVWDGSSWGNLNILSASGVGDDRTDIYTAYESKSGEALVVFAKGTSSVSYKTWNGGWNVAGELPIASGASGNARWTGLASDPNSNRIALSVITADNDAWVSIWDGETWETPFTVTNSLPGSTFPAVAVAFESISGTAKVVYAENSKIYCMDWVDGFGWANKDSILTPGASANTIVLDADPYSNKLMLTVQDNNSDLYTVLWNGTSWGTPLLIESNTDDTKNQPFLYLWNVKNLANNSPILAPIGDKSVTENVALNFTTSATDVESTPSMTSSLLPTGATYIDNGNGTGTFNWTPTFLQSGIYSITFYATDDSGDVISEAVQIDVIEAGNQPPLLILPAIGPTAENININFDAYATDAESIPVMTSSTLPTGASYVDNGDGTGTFDWTPTSLQSGTYQVTFYATDDSSKIDSNKITFNIIDAGNQLPILAAIGAQSTTENINLNFTTSATDIESTPDMTISTLPSGASYVDNGDGTGTFNWTPMYPSAGSYNLTFYATDDSLAVDSEIVVITVDSAILDYIVISPNTMNINRGDTVQFSITGFDADSNPAYPGTITWKALGRCGTINSSGLYVATNPGRSLVTAVSSLNAITDTSGYINVEELYLTTISLGNEVIRPNNTTTPVMALRIDNYFDSSKTINGFTFRDLSRGLGSSAQLLSNVDSLSLYYDIDNDSILSPTDSLIVTAEYNGGSIPVTFSGIEINSYTGKTFLVGVDAADFPRDGDTLDLFIIPASDISVLDGSIVTGPDTANSYGYVIFDGMVSEQLNLISSGIAEASPGDSIYNLMIVDIPRNGYQEDTLRILNISNSGTAGNNCFDSLMLFADNGDLICDYSDDNYFGKLSFTGNQWTLSGLNIPLPEVQNRFYVGADISSYPINGAVISLGIPLMGIEVSSQNDGPVDIGIPAIDTVSIVTSESIVVEPLVISSRTLIPGTFSDVLTSFKITNAYNSNIAIDSILLTMHQLNVDIDLVDQSQLDGQIDSVYLYMKKDSDYGRINASDSLIYSGVLSDGQLIIDFNGITIGSGGVSKVFAVAASMNLYNCKNGNTINFGIDHSTDIYCDAAIINGSFPLANYNNHSIDIFPLASVNINNISGTLLFGGQTNRPILDIEIPRNGYANDILQQIQMENKGTLEESAVLSAVKLWADKTDNGYSDDDQLIAEFSQIGNLWYASEIDHSLANQNNRLIITVSILNVQFEGGTLNFEIPTGGIKYQSGTDGPDDLVLKNPEAHLIFPSNRITVVSLPTASKNIYPASSGNLAVTFALYNGYIDRAQTLTAINLTNNSHTTGSQQFVDYEMGQVSLYMDSNGDRIFNDDRLLSSGRFLNGQLQLNGLESVLNPEELTYFFAIIDIPSGVKDSDSLSILIEDPSDLTFASQVNINGDLPAGTGGYLVIDGSVTGQYRLIDLPPRTISPGDTSVSLISFYPAYNGFLADTLTEISIGNDGDADASDIISLELWQDTNKDSVWQSTDLLLNIFSFENPQWKISDLNLEIDSLSPPLIIIADISPTAQANKTFQVYVPENGCEFHSTNDGPINDRLISKNRYIVSSSGLRIDYQSLAQTYSVGQTIDLRMSVTNRADSIINNVFGEIVSISHPSIVTSSGGYYGPVSLNPDESIDFDFEYIADSAGSVCWQLQAIAGDIFDSSVVIETDTIQIQNSPDQLSTQLINSVPASVVRGQINIFPVGLTINHPNTDISVASLRLDSLRLKVTNGLGVEIPANSVFSRMVLTSEYNNLAILNDVPEESEILYEFNNPVVIAPGKRQTFTLLVDIDSLATADNFSLSFESVNSIPVVDNNTGQLIGFNPGQVFPMETDICRIDNASHSMVIAYEISHTGYVNFGQEDFDLIHLQLRHPETTGSSSIQLTGLSLQFIDSLGEGFIASQLFDEIKMAREQLIVGTLTGNDLNQSNILFTLNSPITLNAGERDSLRVLVTLSNESVYGKFGLKIIDSTSFYVRDLSSGSSLITETDTTLSTEAVFPILSGLVEIKQPAIAADICIDSDLPVSLAGGADAVSLINLNFKYPVTGESNAPVYLKNALVAVIDSLQSPLNPDQLFDRIGFSVNGGTVSYQSFIPLLAGLTQFNFGSGNGLLLNQGDSLTVTLVADIESDAPYDHFMISVSGGNAIILSDVIDSTNNPGVEVSVGCGSMFPYVSPVAQIYLPAGRPGLTTISNSVLLAYPGQSSIKIFEGIWSYYGSSLQGDVVLHNLIGQCLQRTPTGLSPISADLIFDTISFEFDNELLTMDTIYEGDTIALNLEYGAEIPSGFTADFDLVCKIKDNAPLGNYIIRFNDSTFMNLTDKNIGTGIYPVLNNGSYPIYSRELSLATCGLEESFTNYPNPFNPADDGYTTIGFILIEPANIDIELFTITGDKVSDLVSNDYRVSGEHQTDLWSGLNDAGQKVISGTYFCRITARYVSGETEEFTRKITVIR